MAWAVAHGLMKPKPEPQALESPHLRLGLARLLGARLGRLRPESRSRHITSAESESACLFPDVVESDLI